MPTRRWTRAGWGCVRAGTARGVASLDVRNEASRLGSVSSAVHRPWRPMVTRLDFPFAVCGPCRPWSGGLHAEAKPAEVAVPEYGSAVGGGPRLDVTFGEELPVQASHWWCPSKIVSGADACALSVDRRHNSRGDVPGDFGGGFSSGIAFEMGNARRRAHHALGEQVLDHRQGVALGESPGGLASVT